MDKRIEHIQIDDIVMYSNNPRHNDGEAVDKVAASIKEYGFKVPMVLDKNNVIITGHTRYKAAKKLKLDKVPCIIADDLTDAQVKAFRIADNKVSEYSSWDYELLNFEFEELKDLGFDMEMTGFDDFEMDAIEAAEDFEMDEFKEHHRLATDNAYNLQFNEIERTAGFYQMPIIKKIDYIPKDLISFNYAKTAQDKSVGVHFYIDDYQFERVWNNPIMYVDILKEFDCVITPDFSLYLDMPIAMKIWNTYRNRLIGQIMYDCGIKVIPNVSWAEEDTFKFCFDGIEPGGTVSISTIGVKRDPEAKAIWTAGVTEMIKRIKPKAILVYGGKIEYDYPKDIDVIYFENKIKERVEKSKNKEEI